MKIWTLRYTPFVMGGEVWQPVCTEVTASGPFDIGDGYEAYLVIAPNGRTFVAESTSGALVGPDIKTVWEDIKLGDKKIMKKQVEDAIKNRDKAEELEPDEFWKLLKCEKR